MKTTQTPRRIGLAEAKSKLSEIVRDAAHTPTVIQSRGRDLAVVMAVDDYRSLIAEKEAETAGAKFLRRIEAVKKRFGGGGIDSFEPAVFDFKPENPFSEDNDEER